MDKFDTVTVIKKANIFFDGMVTSRTIYMEDGSKKTLGIILPGKYEFDTVDKEVMEILCGSMQVLIPGYEEWDTYFEGQSFEVPAGVRFAVYVTELTDYCCSYFKEKPLPMDDEE